MQKSEIDHETVGQFTGFYDCDGNAIFKDDIIQNLRYPEVMGKVSWYHGCWVVDYGENDDEPNILYDVLKEFDFQVIGNAHENPELMGVMR